MASKPKVKFHPIAQLHVAVTEAYNGWLLSLIKHWRQLQQNEECRRLFLRLKLKANEDDVRKMKDSFRYRFGRSSQIYRAMRQLGILYRERCLIYRNDRYYRSIDWEDKNDSTP